MPFLEGFKMHSEVFVRGKTAFKGKEGEGGVKKK